MNVGTWHHRVGVVAAPRICLGVERHASTQRLQHWVLGQLVLLVKVNLLEARLAVAGLGQRWYHGSGRQRWLCPQGRVHKEASVRVRGLLRGPAE